MAALTNYLENKLIDHIFQSTAYTGPSTLYIALFTAVTDGEAGTVTEVSGGSYARVAVTANASNWSDATGNNGTTANVNPIAFPAATADWGTATHFGIYDASAAGNLLVYAALTASRTITNGSTASFGASTLTVQLDN
ncbi:MAG: hypothetical protein RL563_1103 [Pseudomonadota bacterium]|jgi:hypothetical protein